MVGNVPGPVAARRIGGAAVVLILVLAVVACRPLPLGSAGAGIGNDPSACPQFQPAATPPCGPQPLVWASISGPFEPFVNGDPFSTRCRRDSSGSATCAQTDNPLYDPTGYEYAIDVAPEDVGVPLTVEVYDAPASMRTVSYSTKSITGARTTTGSKVITRSGSGSFDTSDVGKAISGPGIPIGATVASRQSTSQVTLSVAATASATNVTVVIALNPDCALDLAPFTSNPYSPGSMTSQHCQAGDAGSSAFQLQVFENDGNELAVGYDAALPGCHLYLAPGTGAGLKNVWSSVCTFVPTQVGIFPLRVKSSSITLPNGDVVADAGSGYNQFSLRVEGGTTTRLYAMDALSVYTNAIGSPARLYLAEITSASAGRRLQIDLFDPGDGNAGDQGIQVLAPPSGAPGPVPSGGTLVPATGYATSCRYNPTPSPTQGPDVNGSGGANATSCRISTRVAQTNRYNNGWLRIQIDIAPDYACETDCWWTLRYDTNTSSFPTDRTVIVPKIVDQTPPPTTTTTTTAPTTTTTGPVSTTTTIDGSTTTTSTPDLPTTTTSTPEPTTTTTI